MEKLIIKMMWAALSLPEWMWSLLYLGRRVRKDGLSLDAKAQFICALTEKARNTPFETLTPEQSRRQMAAFCRLLGGKETPVEAAEDITLPSLAGKIPARLYRPLKAGEAPLPILIYYHGGGWIQGDINTHDEPCRRLAQASGGLVLSVAYRLAPEHKYPAAVEDAVAAFRWVRTHGMDIEADSNRIAVGGDSAGGNLAAVVCQICAKAKEPGPMFQVLIYPALDSRMTTPSHALFADGFFLTRERIDWYMGLYLNDIANERDDPRFAPALTTDLSNLPPALIMTAGFDPLRDEGRAYHERLRTAGILSEYRQYDGMIHAFINAPGVLSQAKEALHYAGQTLRKTWEAA